MVLPVLSGEVLTFGFVTVRWYGLIMATAMGVAWLVARRLVTRWGGVVNHMDGLVPWLVVGGLFGARLVAVLAFEPGYYLSKPVELLAIWHGGISILGGITGGVIALWLYCRRYHLNIIPYIASLAVVLPLAQAIGRWGNYFNQELYGRPSNLPLTVAIDAGHRLPGYEQFITFQPLFLYESLLNLALFAFLWSRRSITAPAQLPWMYLVGYGCIRFIMEFGRIDPVIMFGPLRLSQLIAAIIIIVGVAGWLKATHSPKTPAQGG